MRTAGRVPYAVTALALLLLGCPKGRKGTENGPEGKTGPQVQAPPPLLPIGMTDPFARLSGAAARSLGNGYKALKAKKFDDAATEFRSVLQTAPDNTEVRFRLAGALAQGGHFPEARRELEEVLARDFVAYAGRADKAREWRPFRDSPEWAAYREAEARYRAAYAEGLGIPIPRGFVLVARDRADKTRVVPAGETRLEQHQEAYHYDPATLRFRRLTATDGHVYAAARSADGRTLAFLVVQKMNAAGGFLAPQAGYLDLATLETVGPFNLPGSLPGSAEVGAVSLGFAADRQPVFVAQSGGAERAYVVDTAHTGLTPGATAIIQGEATMVTPLAVKHALKGAPEGVALAADRRSFSLTAGGQVTAARELAESSLDFSPGKKRITYAGALDACKILSEGEAGQNKNAKNELFVYDLEKKSAQRIDSGVSAFETLWLDDNTLVYENGFGQQGTVNLYDFAAHRKLTLPTRHGAGLYGVPTLACEKPAAPEGDAAPEPAAGSAGEEQGD